MGVWIKPENIAESSLITDMDRMVRNERVTLKSLAPFGRYLLEYDLGELPQELYFNLYNNIWNTNFPMWYGDDALFCFEAEERKEKI